MCSAPHSRSSPSAANTSLEELPKLLLELKPQLPDGIACSAISADSTRVALSTPTVLRLFHLTIEVCLYVGMYVCIFVCVCACVCVCVCVYVHMYKSLYVIVSAFWESNALDFALSDHVQGTTVTVKSHHCGLKPCDTMAFTKDNRLVTVSSAGLVQVPKPP